MQIAQKNLYKKILGRAGEVEAGKFLKKQGYSIKETNYKTRVGEADIIAEHNGVIVFVEVKTRSGDEYGEPSEAVNRKKREKYFRVANEYLVRTSQTHKECRFDIIEIKNGQINHITDAFSM